MEILLWCAPCAFPALADFLHLKRVAQSPRATPKAAMVNRLDQQPTVHLEIESAKAQFAEVMARLARIEAKIDLLPNKAMQSN